MARISRVGHVVLTVKDVMTSVDFYTKALGMKVVDLKEYHRAAFLSFGMQCHDVALFRAPEGAERGMLGLSRVAFQIEGGLPGLRELKGRLEAYGAVIDDMVDHTVIKSVYFQDPDGNRLEIYTEGFEDPGEEVERNSVSDASSRCHRKPAEHEERVGTAEIVAVLIKHRNDTQRSDRSGLPQEVGDLIYTNSFAFIVGAAFDRGMPWQKAWEIPYWIEQKGKLEASRLAAMEEPDLQNLLESLPVKPRYGCVGGARTLREAANLVLRFDTGGNASAIWNGAPPSEVQKRLESVYGIGPGIAHMVIRILRDDWGVFRGQEHEIDIKPDVHVKRVFKRTGLTETENASKAVEAARELSPWFPGELDWPAWDIGIHWCRPANPLCGDCPLTAVCPRRI